MQHVKLCVVAVSVTALATAMLPSLARSQSGRGRPRVQIREPETPPPPVKVPEAASVIKQEQVRNVSRFLLRNGITVIISEQHATPLVAAVAYFKAGRMNEPDQAAGAADLIARAMPAQRAKEAAALGAIGGAYASADHTSFYLLIPPDKLKDALAVQARMVQDPPALGDDFRRDVFPEDAFSDPCPERRGNGKGRDAQLALSLERLKSIAFTRRGTARLPEAAESSAISRDQVLEYSRAYYKPENLILSIAGDVSTFSTLVEVQRLYAGFGVPVVQGQHTTSRDQAGSGADKTTTRPAPVAKTDTPQTKPALSQTNVVGKVPPEPDQTELRYGADRGDISQPVVTVGFRVPGLKSKSWPAVEVLSAILGQGRASRLNRALVDGQAVVSSVDSGYAALADSGLLTIQMKPALDATAGSMIDKAESALFREIERLRHEIPSEGEMARARTLVEKRFVDRVEGYLGRAETLARAEAAGNGFRDSLDYRKLVRDVRAEDVQRAAAAYLNIAGATVHEYEPVNSPARTFDAARFAATVRAWAPGMGEPINPKEVATPDARNSPPVIPQGAERSADELAALESLEPLPVKDFSTLNGPLAFVREDHSQAKVTIALLFSGGRAAEDETRSGITELLLRAMLRGTPRRPSNEVSQELEQLGAEVDVVAEPDFFGLLAEVPSRNADRTLKILRDLIEEPAFRDTDVSERTIARLVCIVDFFSKRSDSA